MPAEHKNCLALKLKEAIRTWHHSSTQYISVLLETITKNSQTVTTVTSIILAFANITLVLNNKNSLDLATQANTRAEQLYMGEIRPLIGVTPIGISQRQEDQAETCLRIINYSGFPAKNIAVDIKYGEHGWITEWTKAYSEGATKGTNQTVVLDKLYQTLPAENLIPILLKGESRTCTGLGIPPFARGALKLETEVCTLKDGLPVSIRTTWQNENGHVFDEVKEYKLLCTTSTSQNTPSTGRSFNFFPNDPPPR